MEYFSPSPLFIHNKSFIYMNSNTSFAVNPSETLHNFLMTINNYRTAMDLYKQGFLIIVVIGCLGNMSAFLLMLSLRSITMCNYMAALAIADTSVLLGPCLIHWLRTHEMDPRSQNTALCRFLYFQTYWSLSLSAWIMVAMTVDRFVAISFPLRSRFLSTPKIARVVILSLAFVLTLINGHFFFTMEVSETGQTCVGYDKYEHFLQVVWPWVDATIYSFFPFTMLLVFNILIIITHHHYLKRKVIMTGRGIPANGPSAQTANRKLTITLLAITITFMLLTAPRALLFIIRYDIFNFRPSPHEIDFKILANFTLTSALVNFLMYINHSINFFLYCMTGKKFRRQISTFFKKCQMTIDFRQHRIVPSEVIGVFTCHIKRPETLTENNIRTGTEQETEA